MPRLLVIKGADEGKQFELDVPQLAAGRDAQNEIRLHDTEVSRKHAEFVGSDKGYLLRDVGSANGTFVNNKKIDDAILLQPGDRIVIGQTLLVYSTGTGNVQHTPGDLAHQINLISRHDLELSSAIIKTVTESEGSQILTNPEKAKTPWLRTALANLRIMYESSQAISHILDLDELLSRILELIFRSITADRGCVMLHNTSTGQFEPKALRWRKPDKQVQKKMTVSRTIIEHVLRQKEGILVTDASQDDRFSTGQSIVRFGIREVICVPMRGRHETIGALYLDTQANVREMADRNTSLGKFNEDHLALAVAIAHQAALAVEETRYHQAMVQAERLAAIGQTVATLAHNIKNILQGLRSGSDILKLSLEDKKDPLLEEGWRLIERNQNKISDLVMDMLSYSKDRVPDVEEMNINDVVQEVYDLTIGRAKELGARLDINLESTLPQLLIDPTGIHHALLNIVGNAIDAVEDRNNPQVVIGTRLDPEPGWIRIMVVDNGKGIPKEKLNDIFNLFVSTKGAKGTGLGLPVSRKILREHGGDIVVESQVGKGSRFVLRLPIKSPLDADISGHTIEGQIVPPPDDA